MKRPMNVIQEVHRIRVLLSQLDDRTLAFVRNRATLIAALITLGICVWGWTSGRHEFVFAMTAMGAVGYFAGLTVALVAGMSFIGVELFNSSTHIASAILLEWGGYVCIGWLGYRHKKVQRAQLGAETHPAWVLPWAVVNEVRTSLAAVRFLLFPTHEDHENQALQQATNELSRLEQLFNELEQSQRPGEKSKRR
ncbi:hypothetical protein ALPO108162_09515 [Alicyclobacillus pomorum]